MTDALQPAVWSRRGDVWFPDASARGPWDERMTHGGAPCCLLARAVERAEGGDGLAVIRIAYEFFGAVPVAPASVDARVVKGGKRFQVVEARLAGEDGRLACRATGLRLRREPTADAPEVPGPELPRPPAECPEYDPLDAVREGVDSFFPTAMEIRLAGGEAGTGRLTAWFRLRRAVVAGEKPTGVQRAAAAADFANGLSWVLPFTEWTFVNTDLTVHLQRDPVGEWIALDARTDVGDQGAGVASAVLFDERGRVGTCAQALFIERR